MAFTTPNFKFGETLDAATMNQLQANFQGLAHNETGAPPLHLAALDPTPQQEGEASFSGGGTWVPAAGIYTATIDLDVGFEIRMGLFDWSAGVWRDALTGGGGGISFATQGGYVRFIGNGAGSGKIYWHRLY